LAKKKYRQDRRKEITHGQDDELLNKSWVVLMLNACSGWKDGVRGGEVMKLFCEIEAKGSKSEC
jgi:hypothetical protein